MRVMILPSRSAIGTPRRRIPTNPKPSTPPFFSTISYASRTSVRSISDADISCAFWRRPVLREGAFAFIVACTSQNVSNRMNFSFLPDLPPLLNQPKLASSQGRLLTVFNAASQVKRHGVLAALQERYRSIFVAPGQAATVTFRSGGRFWTKSGSRRNLGVSLFAGYHIF